MAREKTPPCNRGCGQRVWFNWSAKAGEPGRSDYGKLRALQVSSEGELLDEIHECPNSTYGGKRQGGAGGNGQMKATVNNTTIETLLGNSYDHAARLEKIEGQLQLVSRILTQINDKIDRLGGQTHINNNNSEPVTENSETNP